MKRSTLVAILLVGSLLVSVAFAATPQFVEGNPRCSDFGYDNGVTITTSAAGTYTSAGFTVVLASDGTFSWTSAIVPVSAVIAKGGPNANIYGYAPPAFSDSGLSAPINPNTGRPFGLSHVDFCFDDPTTINETLSVTKTAQAGFERQVDWTLAKRVAPTTLSGRAGMVAGSVDWTIEAERTLGEPMNFSVSGTITISNPAAARVFFDITDTLFDAAMEPVGTAEVTCPAWVIEPGTGLDPTVLTCTYVATVSDDSAVLNEASVVVTDVEYTGYDIIVVAGDDGYADILTWNETLLGAQSATLSDPRFEPGLDFPVAVPPSATIVVPETFVCPPDPNLYSDGEYVFAQVNTAYLTNADVAYDASATVTITCTLDPLAVRKTATGLYDRTVEWDLVKSVAPASHTGFAGELAGSSTYTIVATKEETLGNYRVSGIITIVNSADVPQAFSVTDVLNDTTVAVVDCPALIVPALGSIECPYLAAPADASATLNTATVTAVGNPAQVATAPVSFSDVLVGYDEGTLSDPMFGLDELISSTTTRTFTRDFLCSSLAADYTDGEMFYFVDNTATLNGGIDLSDDAQVRVDCTLPALQAVKTAAGTYDRTVRWTLTKGVAPDAHSGMAGEMVGTSTYTIVATKAEVLGNYGVTGTISVTNPAAIAQTFAVSDALNDGTVAVVDCPTNTAAPAETVVCTYTAAPPDATATLNTATVTAPGNGPLTASAGVTFIENLIGYDSGWLSDPMFALGETIAASTTRTFTHPFECPANTGQYVAGFYTFTVPNTATLNGGIDLSASALVSVTCEDPGTPGRPSLEVYGGTITSAARGSAAVSGSFGVQNVSSGVTFVTIGDVGVSFTSRLPRGVRVEHSADCLITPEPNGFVLAPDASQGFSYTCTIAPAVAENANELTALVTVGSAMNQIGEIRDRSFSDNSTPYTF